MIEMLVLSLALALALGGCSGREGDAGKDGHAAEAEHGEGEHEAGAAELRMNDAELKAAGVTLETLAPGAIGEELRAPGEVVDNAYGTTLITPSVEAIVVSRHAKLGDEVAAGAALVTLASAEIAEAYGEQVIAEQDLKRVQALGREAVSARRWQEAEVAAQQARAKVRTYTGAGSASSNGEFTLNAPHAGRITQDDFLVGERVESGRTLFRLVDESIVWVDARLPSLMAGRVPVDSPAQVVVGEKRIAGKVVQRAHRTAEETRNTLLRVEVPNEGDVLHAGDYVDVYVDAPGAGGELLSVPTAAIVQMSGEASVFRRDADGSIEPVAIRAGEVVGDRTIVQDGLAAGDAIVATGAFDLKARILKSQMGEGHAD